MLTLAIQTCTQYFSTSFPKKIPIIQLQTFSFSFQVYILSPTLCSLNSGPSFDSRTWWTHWSLIPPQKKISNSSRTSGPKPSIFVITFPHSPQSTFFLFLRHYPRSSISFYSSSELFFPSLLSSHYREIHDYRKRKLNHIALRRIIFECYNNSVHFSPSWLKRELSQFEEHQLLWLHKKWLISKDW